MEKRRSVDSIKRGAASAGVSLKVITIIQHTKALFQKRTLSGFSKDAGNGAV